MSEPREMSAREQDTGFLLWLESSPGEPEEETVPWEEMLTESERAA